MIRPFVFLLGYTRLRVARETAGELMNICRTHGFVYRNFEFCGEYACFDCPFGVAKRLAAACRERGIAVVSTRESGLPGLIKRYRYRFGVWLGILLFAAVVCTSSLVIWDVRVEGNRRLEDAEVLEALREQGLRVGVSKSSLDIDALENRVMLYSDDIAWISVNVIGTVANVELREVDFAPEETLSYAAADLVATRGGIIEWLEDVRGNVAVNIGDAVAAGDLLVGGLYGSEGVPPRYTCAEGRVMARTEHDFSVSIPLNYEKKVYTGRVWCEKSLIFFEKEVKFFKNTGNCPPTCDTIETVAYLQTWEDHDLPVAIRTVRYYEYEMQTATRSADVATELALYALRCRIGEETPDALLTKKTMQAELTEEHYVLNCRIECIENIAKTVEIPIVGLPREQKKG